MISLPRIPFALAIACIVFAPVAARAQTGTIAGTVVEDGTSTPLFGSGAQRFFITAYTSDGHAAATADTVAPTGRYQITNLAPGAYFVKASTTPGYVLELYNNIACIAEDCPVTAGAPVTVVAGATTTVDFSLAKGGTITGSVQRAENGSGIGGLTVDIYNASTSFVSSSTITESDGTFVVDGLATGTYLARATTKNGAPVYDYIFELYGGVLCPHLAPEGDCRIASSAPIAVTAGQTTTGIDFSLDKSASVSGRVTAEGTGTPLWGARVFAYLGTTLMGVAGVDPTGTYTVTGLPPGHYRLRTEVTEQTRPDLHRYVDEWQNGVCVGCPGALATLSIGTGQTVSGVDFALPVGGSIAGTTTCAPPSPSDRRPEIAVFSSTGEFVRGTSVTQARTCAAPASYLVEGLPTGTYYLWARDRPRDGFATTFIPGNYIDQLYGGTLCNTADCDVRAAIPVTVTAGATTTGVDFTLNRGGTIANLPALQPVRIYDARGIEVINAIGSVFGTGAPIVSGLPFGTYYVTAGGHVNGGPSCPNCPLTASVPVVVGPTGNSPVTFPIAAGRIKGTITNASNGAPLSTIKVEIFSTGGVVVATGVSDLFGHFTVARLDAGTYFARTANDRGFIDEIYKDSACGACDPRNGTPIVVPLVADVIGIDFELASGGIITGLVTDTGGNPLASVPVSVFASTNTLAGVGTSTASGRYWATVSAGTHRVLAEATSSNDSEIFAEVPCTSAGCDPATGTAVNVTTGNITAGIDFTLSSCSAMVVSPSVLATGVVSTSYRQVLGAVGGTGPYKFNLTSGTLPFGVTLNPSTGTVQGTPTSSGRSSFRIAAVDANGCATDRAYVLDVQACAFTLSPANATLAATGGTVSITIVNTCGVEDVLNLTSWVSVSRTPGHVMVTVEANTQATPRTASLTIGRRVFEVRQAGVASQAPYGFLDQPLEGAQATGALVVSGWALDDLEVTRVRIYRDAAAGEPSGLKLVGTAVVIPGARPDVQASRPGVPFNDRAGFGYLMLTNTLPNQGNGSFRIHAVAEDAEGHSTVLGSRTIVVNNATSQLPFGTIDTPGQGQAIRGSSYINFGWALTPQPAMIPADGSTIQVLIDGAPIGTLDYNHFRPDVSNAFPGLANSGGPVGFRAFDTTALSEGLHTISWTVTDSRPATAGLGSRYFIVANSADAPASSTSATTTQTAIEATDVAQPLGAAAAPDLGRRAESLAVASADQPAQARRLTVTPMERVEIALDSLLEGAAEEACPATWAGYLSKNNVLTDLPVGASLDSAGTFYWQTGPGFAGRFPLVFVRTNCRGEKQQVPVNVTIPIR